MKYVTVTVVDSMHDVLAVQAESDAAMYAVWRDYLMTLIMIFSVPLIFKFTLADAYLTLTNLGGTTRLEMAKFVAAYADLTVRNSDGTIRPAMFILLLAAVIFSVFRALKINKPLMV